MSERASRSAARRRTVRAAAAVAQQVEVTRVELGRSAADAVASPVLDDAMREWIAALEAEADVEERDLVEGDQASAAQLRELARLLRREMGDGGA